MQTSKSYHLASFHLCPPQRRRVLPLCSPAVGDSRATECSSVPLRLSRQRCTSVNMLHAYENEACFSELVRAMLSRAYTLQTKESSSPSPSAGWESALPGFILIPLMAGSKTAPTDQTAHCRGDHVCPKWPKTQNPPLHL